MRKRIFKFTIRENYKTKRFLHAENEIYIHERVKRQNIYTPAPSKARLIPGKAILVS